MRNKLTHISDNLAKIIERYYLMLICSLVFMVAVLWQMELAFDEDSFFLVKLAFTASLGIPLTFGLAMFGQRRGFSWLWNLAGLVFLTFFFLWILPTNEADFSDRYSYILIPCYILAHLFVALAPFYKKGGHDEFWQYNKKLFINFFLTIVFTGVLAAGVELALAAVDNLFIMDLDSLYGRVFFAIAIFGSTVIFSLFCADGVTELESEKPYPTILKFFTQFILIPLLLLYLLILYGYGLKIVLAWELPKGWVSYLVLSYGVVGIFALLLVYPLFKGKSKIWVYWFRKIFYYSLLPLLALLFVAISERIHDYGITEGRYFVAFLALWLTYIALYNIFSHNPKLKMIPLSLFLPGILILILPFANVFSVSIRSQENRLYQLLETNSLLDGGKILVDKKISQDLVSNLNSKYRYLEERQEADFVWKLLDEESLKSLKSANSIAFEDLFENRDGKDDNSTYTSLQNSKMVFGIDGYSYLHRMPDWSANFKIGSDDFNIQRERYGQLAELTVSINGNTKDLMPLIKNLVEPYKGQSNKEVENLFATFAFQGYEGKIVFDWLRVEIEPDSIIRSMTYRNAVLLLRKKAPDASD